MLQGIYLQARHRAHRAKLVALASRWRKISRPPVASTDPEAVVGANPCGGQRPDSAPETMARCRERICMQTGRASARAGLGQPPGIIWVAAVEQN